ncbi:SCP2 sterol-binding domain-containing protein [Halorientalis sp.]|uniref:SCP2 sterol-binding domain-containing protein n=1 Tax=Halorientalis sp. TaxID=1931229 RepID=UPI00260FA077|nr:SCP2 sterol-binding domain-containing protein [Halorientalis sp.]
MADGLMFPSSEWFDDYQQKVNSNEEYAEKSAGWGVDFNGDFIFKMTDMPLDEIDVEAMPEHLQEELDQYVTETSEGHTGLSIVGLEDGECTEASLIESEDEVDNGFKLTGTYENWVELTRGNIGAVDGMMSGKFELDGDMQKILQYSDAATLLTECAGQVDSVFAHEEY